MAFAPGYLHDVFVSYAWVDDVPLPGAESGWVTMLVRHLKFELARRLGRESVSIWMDPRLAGNGPPTPEDLSAIRQSAILLVILSPAYLVSEWCRNELNELLNAAKDRQRAESRIFIVEKSQVDWNDRPAEFADLAGYRFWDEDPGSGTAEILDSAFPGPDRSGYYRRLSQLSHELAGALRQLQVPAEGSAPTVSAGSGSARNVIAGFDAVIVKSRRLSVPDVTWVEIPGGPFIYQQGETHELDTFWIGKYPITNRQYQTFINDNGYQDERWWRDLEKREPWGSGSPKGNHPRTNVNWYEAVAFARWLTVRLGLPEGTIRLPTEHEWEKAARGTDGRVYPWANDDYWVAHFYQDTEGKDGPWWMYQQTVAVGLHPLCRSPYEVEDLADMVWEWCLNKYDESDVTAPDLSGGKRTLRGGCWFISPSHARADNRLGGQPDSRDSGHGFRVVSSVPMPVR